MDKSVTAQAQITRLTRLDPASVACAQLILCDLDGCLISEGRPFADAPDFVAACGARLWLVSNRSDMTAEALSEQLGRMGLDVPAVRIVLAGEFTLRHLAGLGVTRLDLRAAPPLQARARELGLDIAADRPEALVLCRDPEVNVETMGAILARLDDGVPLWVSNEDRSHPDHLNRPVVETGALLAAMRAVRPGLTWRCLGKPNAAMLHHALRLSGLSEDSAVFVGDNAATDGAAALSAGVPFYQIKRGGAE